MSTVYRPRSPQEWVTSFVQPEEVIQADFEEFTMNISATFTLNHREIADRLQQLSAAAKKTDPSTVVDLRRRTEIFKKLQAYNDLFPQGRSAYSLSTAGPEAIQLSKDIIFECSQLPGVEAGKELASRTEGEPLHADEINRFAYHLNALSDIFQYQAPAILESFTEDCAKTTQASTVKLAGGASSVG